MCSSDASSPEIKGQDLLIRALGILAREGISNISAEFIGDGSGRQQLEELARNEGVLPQVSFAGSLSRRDTYRRLATYDLMIHPSRIEEMVEKAKREVDATIKAEGERASL